MNCWLDIDLARWVPRKWLEDYSHLHLGGFGRCAKNSSRDLWIFRPFLWRIIWASWLLLMLLRQKSSSWPKLCTLFYTPIKGTWLFPAIACLDLKFGKDPPLPFMVQLLWHLYWRERRQIPNSVERRMAAPIAVGAPKAESWSTDAGRNNTGLVEGLWPFVQRNSLPFLEIQPNPPRNSLDLKELAKGLANPTQGWEKSGCENRFVFPFSNSGCFCRDFHKDGVTKVLSKRAHKSTKFLKAV